MTLCSLRVRVLRFLKLFLLVSAISSLNFITNFGELRLGLASTEFLLTPTGMRF